tara:strand:+ start:72 stop:671 length:600 start_codon:yes stop_codon:yes gene_type:complete
MINEQLINRSITGKRTIDAISNVPRHLFTQYHGLEESYSDKPLQIGYGQTISQPYIVALMSEQFEEIPHGGRILEIGSGSGYQTAILVQMGFEVYSVEIVHDLFIRSKRILSDLGLEPAGIICSDAREEVPDSLRFNGIISAACAEEIPEIWLEKLEIGGILVTPTGDKGNQTLVRLEKGEDGNISEIEICSVRFVPLK